MFKILSILLLFLVIFTQNIIGEPKVKISLEENRFNHQIKKIFNSGEYNLHRSKSLRELKNYSTPRNQSNFS